MGAQLVAHKGTVRIPEEAVRAVPCPDFTRSWRPYSHGEILDALASVCEAKKFQVVRKEYSMTASGSRLFGAWEIATYDAELNLAIGFRNSLDKHFAVGLCAGERVFVCDNLAFDSEFVIFRKHSSLFTMDELVAIADEAMAVVLRRFERLRSWHTSLKSISLSAQQAAFLASAAIRRGLLAASSLPQFLKFYEEPKYSPSLHGWHGALTEVLKDQSLLTIQYKNADLNRFLRYEVPLLTSASQEGRVDWDGVAEQAAFEAEARERVMAEETAQQTAELRSKVSRGSFARSPFEISMKDVRANGGAHRFSCGLAVRGQATKS